MVAGVWGATLSSALGSCLGAPRILQAVARDRILPILKPFASGSKMGDEPRPAMIFGFIITIAVLLWAGNSTGGGALNAIAPMARRPVTSSR